MKRFTLTATLLEDMHSGAGVGNAAVDALQLRDRRGRPVLRASHVLGVLREQAELLASDELRPHTGFTSSHVEELFGRPTAARGGKLIAQSLYWCHGGTLRVWTSSSRVPGSRVPAPDHMHTREFVPRGSKFSGVLWLASDDSVLERLLNATVLRTDVVGGRRERGSGVVKLALDTAGPGTIPRSEAAAQGSTTDKVKLRLLLRALDPLALPATGTPDNVVPSECYIRGQQVLGACASYAFSAGQSIAAAEMLAGAICFSNAYPLPDIDFSAGWPPEKLAQCDVVPIPLTLRRVKAGGGSGEPWPWWAEPKSAEIGVQISSDDSTLDRFAAASSSEKRKTKRPGDREFLFSAAASDWLRFQPTMLDHMRNAKPANVEEDGALFVEDEIAEDTRFICDIDFSAAAEGAIERFESVLSKVLHGQDCLTVGRGGRPVIVESWSVFPEVGRSAAKPEANAQTLRVFLESDLIARDDSLNFAGTLDLDLLLAQTGAEKSLRARAATAAQRLEAQSECDVIPIYGFNYASGLPRAAAIAVRRGSILQVTAQDDDARALLGEIRKHLTAWSGPIGDRAWEGFGRIRTDFDPMKKPREDMQPGFRPPALSFAIATSAQCLEEVMSLAEQAAKTIAASMGSATTVSQWSGFRADVLASPPDELDSYFDYLRDHRAHTKAGAFWTTDCKGQPLHAYLRQQLDQLKTSASKRQFANLLARTLRMELADRKTGE